jgi:hypothetical protein
MKIHLTKVNFSGLDAGQDCSAKDSKNHSLSGTEFRNWDTQEATGEKRRFTLQKRRFTLKRVAIRVKDRVLLF